MLHKETHRPHRKNYLVLTTVVVGVILILMLLNDNKGINFSTGSSIGLDNIIGGRGEVEVLDEISKGEELGIELSFDSVPSVKENTIFDSVTIIFGDLKTKIKINEEELELKGLEKAEMTIVDFEGELYFDNMGISLNGEGGKVVINGIEISTKGKMDLSFNDLVYNYFDLKGVELNLLNFETGSGKMVMEEKLDYTLENEEIEFKTFDGDLSVGLDNESLVIIGGTVKGIFIEGEFDLTLG
jgi:hypothetical protein